MFYFSQVFHSFCMVHILYHMADVQIPDLEHLYAFRVDVVHLHLQPRICDMIIDIRLPVVIINSLYPGKRDCHFKFICFQYILWFTTIELPAENALTSVPIYHTSYKSTLERVMAWCHQTTSHFDPVLAQLCEAIGHLSALSICRGRCGQRNGIAIYMGVWYIGRLSWVKIISACHEQ